MVCVFWVGDLRMAQPASQPRRRRALQLLFRLINSVVSSILRSPLHRLLSGRLALLTFYGRKSGRRYTTPVGYGRTDGTLLVDTESPWWRNLRGGARVGVRLRGRDRAGTAEVITDEAWMREAYRIILAATPATSWAVRGPASRSRMPPLCWKGSERSRCGSWPSRPT